MKILRATTTALIPLLWPALAVAGDSALGRDRHFTVLADLIAKPDDKHRPELDKGQGLDLRYGAFRPGKPWGYEVRAFYNVLEPKAADIPEGNRSGLGVDAVYRIGGLSWLTPYLLGGAGLAYNDVLPGRNWMAALVNLGAGVKTGTLAEPGGHALRLRAEIRYSYEDYRDEYSGATEYDPSNYIDQHLYAGLELGLADPAAAAPEPVQVVTPVPAEPAPAPVDSDGDGVTDAQDACPDSPAAKPVDERGCTVLPALTLKGVNFASNSAELAADATTVLDEAVALLNGDYRDARVQVAGHTDNQGAADANVDLSQRRAEAVRGYLVEHGVAAERLSAQGYGAAEPVADNGTAEGRAQNRRVELRNP